MMIFYFATLLLLVLARILVWGRATMLEKKFARLARAARDLAGQPAYRNGASQRPDSYAVAKQQYLLGEVTAKRDLMEARHEAWQARSEKLAKTMTHIRTWKGRTVPYLFGAIDAVVLLVILSVLGVVELPALAQLLEKLASNWRG